MENTNKIAPKSIGNTSRNVNLSDKVAFLIKQLTSKHTMEDIIKASHTAEIMNNVKNLIPLEEDFEKRQKELKELKEKYTNLENEIKELKEKKEQELAIIKNFEERMSKIFNNENKSIEDILKNLKNLIQEETNCGKHEGHTFGLNYIKGKEDCKDEFFDCNANQNFQNNINNAITLIDGTFKDFSQSGHIKIQGILYNALLEFKKSLVQITEKINIQEQNGKKLDYWRANNSSKYTLGNAYEDFENAYLNYKKNINIESIKSSTITQEEINVNSAKAKQDKLREYKKYIQTMEEGQVNVIKQLKEIEKAQKDIKLSNHIIQSLRQIYTLSPQSSQNSGFVQNVADKTGHDKKTIASIIKASSKTKSTNVPLSAKVRNLKNSYNDQSFYKSRMDVKNLNASKGNTSISYKIPRKTITKQYLANNPYNKGGLLNNTHSK